MTPELIALPIIAMAMAFGVWIALKVFKPKLNADLASGSFAGRFFLAAIVVGAVALGVWLGSPDKIDLMTIAVGVSLAAIALYFAFRSAKGHP